MDPERQSDGMDIDYLGGETGVRRIRPNGCDICVGASRQRELDEVLQVETDIRDIARLYDVEERRAGKARISSIVSLLENLGADGKRCRRERAAAARRVVADDYSAPRVTEAARRMPRYGLAPGLALDLTVRDEDGQP